MREGRSILKGGWGVVQEGEGVEDEEEPEEFGEVEKDDVERVGGDGGSFQEG